MATNIQERWDIMCLLMKEHTTSSEVALRKKSYLDSTNQLRGNQKTKDYVKLHYGDAVNRIWVIWNSPGQTTGFPHQVNCKEREQERTHERWGGKGKAKEPARMGEWTQRLKET